LRQLAEAHVSIAEVADMSYSGSSTSETTRAVITDVLKAYSAGDSETLVSLFHPDIVFESIGPPDFMPFLGRHVGLKATLDALAQISDVMSISDYATMTVIADGEYAFSRAIGTYTVRRTGRKARIELYTHSRVVNGLIVSWREMHDTLSTARDLFGIDISMLALSIEPMSKEPQKSNF
jgi:ketosteroid isomerase-like protein